MATGNILIFDYDGVIADSVETFSAGFLAACRRHGLDRISDRETFLRLFDTNLFAGLAAAGCPEARIRPFLATLGEELSRRAPQVRFFAGMPEALRRLRRSHQVFIVTSNLAEIVNASLARHGVDGLGQVLGAAEGTSKVEKIRQVMAANPGAPCFYIGDTRGDIVEGREAGARTVAVTWGWHARERLLAAGPEHVVDTPAGLEALLGRLGTLPSAVERASPPAGAAGSANPADHLRCK